MAEDYFEKSEHPTPKKLEDARLKGVVARSQEFTISMILLINVATFYLFSHFMFDHLKSIVIGLLSNLRYHYQDPNIVSFWLQKGLYQLLILISPIAVPVFLSGLLFNFLQVGLVFSFYPLKPKWSKLNFFASSNYKRYFNSSTLLRLFLSQIRFIITTAASWYIISHNVFEIYGLTRRNPSDLVAYVYNKSIQVSVALVASYVFLAILDLLYERWRFYNEMKMTRRELKDELRLVEGDAQMRSKIRKFMFRMLQNPITINVPKASLIITNKSKTHALAFVYRAESMHAPLCVAKGSGKKAQQILQLAQKNQVPILEEAHLQPKLFTALEVGRYVPHVFFKDVAPAFSKILNN